jgi:hypothetical protein
MDSLAGMDFRATNQSAARMTVEPSREVPIIMFGDCQSWYIGGCTHKRTVVLETSSPNKGAVWEQEQAEVLGPVIWGAVRGM